MKRTKRSLFLIGVILTLFVLQQFHLLGSMIEQIETLPWWGIMVVLGIIFSGYQAFTLSRKDKEIDDKWVEEQGHVYIERMEMEKAKRKTNEATDAIH
ncbi:signal peptidase [Terrilactibacillus sp. BCM23-1]|uniref:Signal peptidase n=1 Tax=Terrilactibacillus tamarindi TaxID=2599694 RepID=A0A6N8CMT4_9BACI|nr:sporulation YhaL family protein [Terrilactibacillus tamarindi]MTT30477.1 signal peptidase [Terrilactibacillus tamarindi]